MFESNLTPTLSDWKDIAAVLGFLVAFAALLKGVIEYVRQGSQKRAELFMTMHRRFKDNPVLNDITEMLETRDPTLASVPFKNRIEYLTFFEEISFMVNSRLIRKEVAHYMFGYYAIRCWQSDVFWHDVNRKGPYWAVFIKFAIEMEQLEKRMPLKNSKLVY